MRVLRIIARMDPAFGGPCQGIRNTIPEMEKLGISNEVVCLDHPEAEFLGKDNFPVHALGPAPGPWSYSPKLLPWLSENLHRFDAVIVHGLWLYHSYAARVALRKLRKKVSGSAVGKTSIPRFFLMPHGMLDPYFQKAPERRLKAIRNWVYWKLIEAGVIHSMDGILFTCQQELLLARQSFNPYQPRAEINVGYGIQPPPPFQEEMKQEFLRQCPQLKNARYVLFLSRIHEKKGVDLLVQAYSELVEVSKGNVPHLVIAGPGLDTPFALSIQHLVQTSTALASRVHFPGMLAGNQKWGAFYGCEAFVLPSHQENFGIAVVEALACGKPVLISDQVNIFKEIQGGSAGLVENDSFEGTMRLLNQWIALSEDEKLVMGKNANEVFHSSFTITRNIRQLITTLE